MLWVNNIKNAEEYNICIFYYCIVVDFLLHYK